MAGLQVSPGLVVEAEDLAALNAIISGLETSGEWTQPGSTILVDMDLTEDAQRPDSTTGMIETKLEPFQNSSSSITVEAADAL